MLHDRLDDELLFVGMLLVEHGPQHGDDHGEHSDRNEHRGGLGCHASQRHSERAADGGAA